MAAHTITVTFEGVVLSLHVFFAGHEISMSQNGKKWSGKRRIDVAGRVRVELAFKAPAGTSYAFLLKLGRTKKLDDSGDSEAPLFTRGYEVEV